MWEVNKLANEGSWKEFVTSSGQGPYVRKRKRTEDSKSGVSEDQLEEKEADTTVNTIHGGFSSGGEMMVAKNTLEGSQGSDG